MILTGNSLGKRQQDLNTKVDHAASQKVPFEEIKVREESSDVDKLFKISVASKYKNTDYVIETLKSGDDLYISKAMKCLWLYDDKLSEYINPDYLHHNVFPFMSSKMKKNFLTTISTQVRNEARAFAFYQYCINTRLNHFAFKFLISTSLEFRTEIIKNNFDLLRSMIPDDNDIVLITKDNFSLTKLYLEKIPEWNRFEMFINVFRNLYSVDPERYLNTLENDFGIKGSSISRRTVLGVRCSRDIMTKYKGRILNHTHLYLPLLNKTIFRKNTSSVEAKNYIVQLFPEKSSDFWETNFPRTYDYVLDLIPKEEKYDFIKKAYQTKYSESEFEMSREFYDQKFYEFMSAEERELWALRHLANPKKSFLSDDFEDREYLWYRFVTFDKALTEIKKLVRVTTDADDRAKIVKVLLETTKNQDELTKLFKYYHERHVNEDRFIKEDFIRGVTDYNLVWEFNENCWTSFNKLLHSVELYNLMDCLFNSNLYTLVPTLFYHVIHKIEFPEGLKRFAESDINYHYIKTDLKRIKNPDHKDIIFQYFKQLYVGKSKEVLESHSNIDDIQWELSEIKSLKSLLKDFNKEDEVLPEIVSQYIDAQKKKGHIILRQSELMKLLKQDSKLTLNKIPLLKHNFSKTDYFKINTLLRKLKVYFAYDLSRDFLSYFSESLSEDVDYRNLFAAVHGIFVLGDESFISCFMKKHAPTDSKIEHGQIDRKLLYIQEAICRFACYSRPPVPLELIRLYIKGDYVHFCLPMFYMYSAILPPQSCIEFVEVLLNAPVSIQKHGLRLAFKCFSFDNLKNLVLNIWNKSKNISLRMVIYTNLFEFMLERNNTEQLDLYKLLLSLTSQLKEDDHDTVISLLSDFAKLPESLRNMYIQTAWKTVEKFPEDYKNLSRRALVIDGITDNIDLIDRSYVLLIVEEYLRDIFDKKLIVRTKDTAKFDTLNNAKYKLILILIAKYDDKENIKSGLELVKFIISKCLNIWNDCNAFDEKYTYFSRSYCNEFIDDLERTHFSLAKKNNTAMNIIFENIMKQLLDALPLHDVYLIIWKLRVLIITNNVLDTPHSNEEGNEKALLKNKAKLFATEVAKVIKEFVDQNNFPLSLLQDVSNIVEHFIEILTTLEKTGFNTIEPGDTRTLVAAELDGSNFLSSYKYFTDFVPSEFTKRA